MKTLLRIVLVLTLLVVLAIGAVIYFLDDIVEKGLEEGLGYATETPVEVDSTDLSLTNGRLQVMGVKIGNPAGYSAEPVLAITKLDTQLDVKSLRGDTPRVQKIHLDGTAIRAEVSGTKMNLLELKKSLDRFSSEDDASASTSSSGADKRYKVDEVLITSTSVSVGGNLGGLVDVPDTGVTLDEIRLTELEGTMAEITQQVLGQLIDTAIAEAKLPGPEQLKELVGKQVEAVKGQVDETKKKIEGVGDDLKKSGDELKDMFKLPGQDKQE